ncbi:uncharacterized protein [Macrobrachium rosenbergii]|uniref:uncharacterized protein n=1 Tax=Macrobrachium rosenbergii TaxID=79674 RepID=UPI0034D3ECD1
MLIKDIIEKCHFIRFQGRLFSVPKRDSQERRVILDLSVLNKAINCPKFKKLTIDQIRHTLPKDNYTSSIDLKDAYWHIPIQPHFRQYLGFRLGRSPVVQIQSDAIRPQCSPQSVHKIDQSDLRTTKTTGGECHGVSGRLADLGGIDRRVSRSVPNSGSDLAGLRVPNQLGKVMAEARKEVQMARPTMVSRKRKASPTRDLQEVNSRSGKEVQKSQEFFQKEPRSAAGQTPICINSRSSLENDFEGFERILILKANKSFREHKVPVKRRCKTMLKPWASNQALKSSVQLVPKPVSVTIHTDASAKDGWGGHSDQNKVSGKWSGALKSCHINIKEMMAVLLSLKGLKPKRGSLIQLFIDNKPVVQCLKRGGSRSKPLNHIVLGIMRLAQVKKWTLSASHLAGAQNVLADSLSRVKAQEGEWELDSGSFSGILQDHPYLQVDLFATRDNHKLPNFVTPYHDLRAVTRDALSLDWNLLGNIYLFPPTAIL